MSFKAPPKKPKIYIKFRPGGAIHLASALKGGRAGIEDPITKV
jgi:hypothetical protein